MNRMRSIKIRALSRLVSCAVVLSFAVRSYAAGPDVFSYQIPFPPPPTDASAAAESLDDRATRLLVALACGSEVDYAVHQTEAGEDSTAILIAKMDWVTGHPDRDGKRHLFLNGRAAPDRAPCRFTRYFQPPDLCSFVKTQKECDDDNKIYADKNTPEPTKSALRKQLEERLEKDFAKNFPREFPSCHPPGHASPIVTLSVGVAVAPPSAALGSDVVRVNFEVPHDCMVAQINHSLEDMMVHGNLGTNGLPCHVFGTNDGDWDVSVRNFTRLAFLNARNGIHQGPEIIHPPALGNLQEHLLTADGGPAQEKYAVTGCGNKEESTGTSQERADERDWTDEPFWRTIGDILSFLLKLLIVIVAVSLAAAILAIVPLEGIILGLAVVAAAIALLADSLPETENHLLMINTSKYLKNQMIIEDVPGSKGANRYRKDQGALKDWLLSKMQSVLKADFVEYNSRPYNRYSTMAIQNIADFANDDDLRLGARLVLDYLNAKFAVGSQQGRRFVPFRRKREAMAECIDFDAPQNNGLFDLICAGDHQIGLNLFYGGQVEQMRDNYVSFGAAAQDIFAVTSSYQPEDFVVDLARNKGTPIFQRIHHTSGEVYSSGASFLISAGGHTSDYAYEFLGITGKADDKGVGMPTTLFLSKSPSDDPTNRREPSPTDVQKPSVSRTTLGELIRIDGQRTAKPNNNPSYDHNLCVWDGFACGVNLVIPPSDPTDAAAGFPTITSLSEEGGPCLSKGPAGTAPEWAFIDSRRCPAYRHAPRFFIAIYRQSCPALTSYCEDNFGFFDVVDASPADNFNQFKAKVTGANPPGFVKTTLVPLVGTQMNGTYHSARGQSIEFQAASSFTRDAGIVSVDGVAQNDWDKWSFAEGSSALRPGVRTPIGSKGDGYVTIWNPRLNKTLELDFRDKDHPHRNLK